MFQVLRVGLDERAVVIRSGLPRYALSPGRHFRWGLGRSLETYNVERSLVFRASRRVLEVLPEDWYEVVRIGPGERAVLFLRGRATQFLKTGEHTYWTVDPTVELRVFDVNEPLPELDEDLLQVIPAEEVIDQTVLEYQRGLLYVDGRFERVLEPGRYALWRQAGRRVSIRVIDMRRTQLTVAGQELMTRDKVTLRMTLIAEYAPSDPATAPHTIANPEAAIYGLVQLAIRQFVASVTLDELLETRGALERYLEETTREPATGFGIRIEWVGVKDIVLPGEMKTLLNRVIEAEKQAAANVILRREDAATTRAQANAARVMAENPILLRLKELEVLQSLATSVGDLKVNLGGETLQDLLAGLRAPSDT